jgi:hypothetical protein
MWNVPWIGKHILQTTGKGYGVAVPFLVRQRCVSLNHVGEI